MTILKLRSFAHAVQAYRHASAQGAQAIERLPGPVREAVEEIEFELAAERIARYREGAE